MKQVDESLLVDGDWFNCIWREMLLLVLFCFFYPTLLTAAVTALRDTGNTDCEVECVFERQVMMHRYSHAGTWYSIATVYMHPNVYL